jgi:hypothetical protein
MGPIPAAGVRPVWIPTIATEFLVLSTLFIGASVLIRVKRVASALAALRSKPDHPNALGKWRNEVILTGVLLGHIVRICFAIPGRDAAAVVTIVRSRYRTYDLVVAAAPLSCRVIFGYSICA